MKLEKREEYKFKEYRSEVLEHKGMKLKTGNIIESQWHQNVIIWKDNRNDNPLARLNKKKMREDKVTNIRDEIRAITNDPTGIKRIIKE